MRQSHSISTADQKIASIRTLHQQMHNHEASPIVILDSCIGRIERLNPTLNAFITVLSDQARDEAKVVVTEIAEGRCRGPLHGIPIAIKDFYDAPAKMNWPPETTSPVTCIAPLVFAAPG
jgi:Asp-tRNA(Asn)/Glu-tRNA(Gln) amidotransferase A subunit family amidase